MDTDWILHKFLAFGANDALLQLVNWRDLFLGFQTYLGFLEYLLLSGWSRRFLLFRLGLLGLLRLQGVYGLLLIFLLLNRIDCVELSLFCLLDHLLQGLRLLSFLLFTWFFQIVWCRFIKLLKPSRYWLEVAKTYYFPSLVQVLLILNQASRYHELFLVSFKPISEFRIICNYGQRGLGPWR